jgi:hypothetical protein
MDAPTFLSFVEFKEGFDPGIQYFDPFVYHIADKGTCPCVKRFDSATPLDRQCSLVATNMIVMVLNKYIVRNCWLLKKYGSTPHFPVQIMLDKIHYLDPDHDEKFFWLFYRETQKNAPQFELMRRVVNIMRSFYVMETDGIRKALDERSVKDQDEKIFGIEPGSIVDVVATRVRGNLQRIGLDWEKTVSIAALEEVAKETGGGAAAMLPSGAYLNTGGQIAGRIAIISPEEYQRRLQDGEKMIVPPSLPDYASEHATDQREADSRQYDREAAASWTKDFYRQSESFSSYHKR